MEPEELSYQECLWRLKSKEVGRLAATVDHYPQVFTVNYRLDDNIVVFRTNPGTMLSAANHANVAFQVDEVDPITKTGWSVLIQGMAEDVTDRHRDTITERSKTLGVQPWEPGEHPRIVRLIPARITGRQLTPTNLGARQSHLRAVGDTQ